MLLKPKSSKYRKLQRNSNKNASYKNNFLIHENSYGLKALESHWINSNQLEAARKAIVHYTKRVGTLQLRVFPDKAITLRTKESRMGSGKGNVDHWVANVRSNTIIFELYNVPKFLSLRALLAAKPKLPLKMEII